MLASFIIPVYKPEYALFKKCLKSLKEQSFKECEYIIVLDGPDNHAREVIGSIKGISFKVVEIPHSGAQKARNHGFKESKGDIVVFFDSDCIIEPDTCKMWMDTFSKEKDISFIYSGYKFLGEIGAIVSEEFDIFTLRCGNYISTCFPMRREVFPGFDEALESLQDWDMWLTIAEKGGKGLYIPGYAFSTAYPNANSISGKGCTKEAWLGRMKAVKVKHNIPDRKVCVSSVSFKGEGIRLAKLIEADYKDMPTDKPNNYETLIQIGFNLHPSRIKSHTAIFNQVARKKIIFWTIDDLTIINNGLSHKALKTYSEVLNRQAIQFVEDLPAKRIMESAGFNVNILPAPMVNTKDIETFPEIKKVLIDITPEYNQIFACLQYSLPDIKLEMIDNVKEIKEYSAILSLGSEKSMSFPVKRMLLAGRNVISDIQDPYCGFVNGEQDISKYMSELVDTVRKRVKQYTPAALDYWKKQNEPKKLLEVINS